MLYSNIKLSKYTWDTSCMNKVFKVMCSELLRNITNTPPIFSCILLLHHLNTTIFSVYFVAVPLDALVCLLMYSTHILGIFIALPMYNWQLYLSFYPCTYLMLLFIAIFYLNSHLLMLQYTTNLFISSAQTFAFLHANLKKVLILPNLKGLNI